MKRQPHETEQYLMIPCFGADRGDTWLIVEIDRKGGMKVQLSFLNEKSARDWLDHLNKEQT